RRYHWHSASVRDFVTEPHTAIVGESQGSILNLVDSQARAAQTAMLDVVHDRPQNILQVARHLKLPAHHDVREANVDLKRLGGILAVAYERDLHDFAELLLLESLGPRTLQSLALVAEVLHGTPSRFDDPARFSFAHGGKDGHPFPVPLKTFDESIDVLKSCLDQSRPGGDEAREKREGFRRLKRFVRAIEERMDPQADFTRALAHERAISASLDGRTVLDGKKR